MASRDAQQLSGPRLALCALLGMTATNRFIPLPAQEQDGQLVFFQLTRGFL